MRSERADSKGFDVVVVGNAGIDTNVYLDAGGIDLGVEANFTENLDYVGQAGGYASRGYAQLGRRVAFVGYVGADAAGRYVLDELAGDGIDTLAVFVDPLGTSRSVNLVYANGTRKNFYDGKGHMDLSPDVRVCRQVLARSRLAHFHIPNWARDLLPIAKELGLTVACDIQDIVMAGDPYRRDFCDYADILFFSAANHPDPAPLIEGFLEARPDQIVIAGMGAQGCMVGNSQGLQFFPALRMKEPVVDTNGAGDGLAVGFLCSYVLDGLPLADSVLRGQIVARFSCGQRASTSTLITRDRLEAEFSARQ